MPNRPSRGGRAAEVPCWVPPWPLWPPCNVRALPRAILGLDVLPLAIEAAENVAHHRQINFVRNPEKLARVAAETPFTVVGGCPRAGTDGVPPGPARI